MPPSSQAPDPSRYQFIPRVLVFLTRGDEVLLIRRADDRPVFPGQYNGLGGHVERGESVVEAARREVLEESGLEAEGLRLCAVVTIDVGENPGIQMHVFRGEAPGGDLKPSGEGALRWMTQSEALQLDLVEDIPELLPKVLAHRQGDPPLWGHYRYGKDGELITRFE
jgi:8-oxo-dGTP diphosphatase